MNAFSLRLLPILLLAQLLPAASISGTVFLQATGKPVHNVTVLLLPSSRIVESDEDGKFSFNDVSDGSYSVVATGAGLNDLRRAVTISGGTSANIEFQMALSPIRQEITVSSSANKVETTLESFQPTLTLDSLTLSTKAANSLGDVLDGEAGVHRRSFGPGSTRPVIRGFDGDRVLILQDGVRTGTLGSQSGDHGEPVDPQSLERVEVVRGPATLLYGSSAMGGVVNMITGHHEAKDQGHEGVHGYLSGIAGTNNGLHGGSAGIDYGQGRWVVRMGSGGQRTSDYHSARERVFNSRARTYNGNLGVSRYGEKSWFTGSFNSQRGTYQIPVSVHEDEHEAEEEEGHGHGGEAIALPVRRWNVRLNGGMRDRLQYSLNYSDWKHQETVAGEVENEFFNKQFDYRAVVEQRQQGPFSGSFGAWGLRRDYEAKGVEAVTPPTIQNAFAVFGVETVKLEKARLQFGGRLETNRFRPNGLAQRNFTGFSGSAGISVPITGNSVAVANYSHAFRAPALEELYARGPHAGLLVFEVGDLNLRRERMDGVDFSYRVQGRRIKTEVNNFYYFLKDQVFLSPTGIIEDGLPEAEYRQSNSRYMGVDARLQAGLTNWAWLNLGFDTVRAELQPSKLSLPRMSPTRGKAGMDFRFKNLSLAPEVVLTRRQDRLFTNETATAGYGLVNMRGAYTLIRQHTVHQFGANWFNAGNNFYRNHLSFIKDIAPEIGRGVSVSYTVRFF